MAGGEDDHAQVLGLGHRGGAQGGVGHVQGAEKALAAGVAGELGEFRVDLLQALEKPFTLRGAVLDQLLLDHDVDDAGAADHVHEVATPGAVDAAGHLEHALHLVQAGAGCDAAALGLLAEGEDVGAHAVVLVGPPLAGGAEARLDLVEDEQEFVAVGEVAQGLQELGAEVVVAALALDGLDDQARDLGGVLGDHGLDLRQGDLFQLLDPGQVLGVQGEGDLGIGDAGPVELGEVLVLSRVGGVGEAERVARAPVEGLLEVDDLGALLGKALFEVLAHLPVEGRLEGVLHGQGAAVDPEQVGQVGRCGLGGEGLHPVRVGGGVDVRVGGLVHRDGAQLGLEGRVPQAGMVVAQGRGGEKGIEIEVFLAVAGVHDPGPLGFLQIHDHVEPVHEEVAAENVEDLGRHYMRMLRFFHGGLGDEPDYHGVPGDTIG